MTKKQKIKLVVTLIITLGTITVAYLQGWFSKSSTNENNQLQFVSNSKSDTSGNPSLTIQSKQNDNGKIEIKQENIAGDKVQGDKVEKHYYELPKKETNKVVDDKRHLSLDDIKRIETQFPSKSTVTVVFPMYDKEAYEYATEIINKLQALGHKVETVAAVQIVTSNPNPRFTIAEINETTKKVRISIQPKQN